MEKELLVVWWWVLAFIAVMLGGYVGGRLSLYLFASSLRREYLELEYRLSDLEARVSRETKVRAGLERQKGRRFEEEVLEAAKDVQGGPEISKPMDWRQWYKKKMLGGSP